MKQETAACSASTRKRWNGPRLGRLIGCCAPVATALVLALLLRLYRLPEQSMWADESGEFFNLTAPDLLTYLRIFEMIIPEQTLAPVYYILQYGWAHSVGMSLPVLRILTIMLGLASLTVAYAIGKYLYGRTAGWIAALCVAVSPQHIYYDQEIRNYALMNLLAFLSVYALLRAVNDGPLGGRPLGRPVWKWWLICLGTNTLLALTHVLATLVIFVEGLFLLLYVRHHFRTVIAWGVAQVVFLIPSFYLIAVAPFVPSVRSPGISCRDIVGVVLKGDLVSVHTDLLPTWKTTPPELLQQGMRRLLAPLQIFDNALFLLLVLGLAWFMFLLVRAVWFRARKIASPADPPGYRWKVCLFLLLFAVVPGSTLGLLETTMHRFLMNPMYSMYNGLALYLGIGALIAALPFIGTRVIAVAVVLALYAYQLLIFLPDVTRTNWQGAAQYIQDHGQHGDRVIDVLCYDGLGQILDYYLDGTSFDVRLVKTFQAACDDALDFFTSMKPESRTANPGSVWVAYSSYPIGWFAPPPGIENVPDMVRFVETRPVDVLRAGCAARGLTVEAQTFRGHYNVVLCRVTSTDAIKPNMRGEPVEGVTPVDYGAILKALGLETADTQKTARRTAALRRQFPKWPPTETIVLVWYGADLLAEQEAELSEAVARYVIEALPGFAAAHFLRGLNLAAKHDDTGALEEFREAFRLHKGLRCLFGRYVEALCSTHDASAVRAELAHLDTMGFILFLPAMHEACKRRFTDFSVTKGSGSSLWTADSPFTRPVCAHD